MPVVDQGQAGGLVRRVFRGARGDWGRTSFAERLLLIVVAIAIVYEWGIGNEIVTPWLSALLLDRLGDGVPGTFAAAGIAAAFTALQQVVVGWMTLYAMVVSPSVVDAVADAVRGRFGFEVPSWRTLPRYQAVAVSFSLGGTFVAVEESLAGARRRRKTVLSSALVCAATVFVVVGGVGSFVLACDGTVLEDAARTLMRVVSNPVPWCVLAIAPSAIKWLRGRRARSDRSKVAQTEGFGEVTELLQGEETA